MVQNLSATNPDVYTTWDKIDKKQLMWFEM